MLKASSMEKSKLSAGSAFAATAAGTAAVAAVWAGTDLKRLSEDAGPRTGFGSAVPSAPLRASGF